MWGRLRAGGRTPPRQRRAGEGSGNGVGRGCTGSGADDADRAGEYQRHGRAQSFPRTAACKSVGGNGNTREAFRRSARCSQSSWGIEARLRIGSPPSLPKRGSSTRPERRELHRSFHSSPQRQDATPKKEPCLSMPASIALLCKRAFKTRHFCRAVWRA
jgi:hypothetical protein